MEPQIKLAILSQWCENSKSLDIENEISGCLKYSDHYSLESLVNSKYFTLLLRHPVRYLRARRKIRKIYEGALFVTIRWGKRSRKWMISSGCMLSRFFFVGWITSVSNRDTRRIGCVTINSCVCTVPLTDDESQQRFVLARFLPPNVSSSAINHRQAFDTFPPFQPLDLCMDFVRWNRTEKNILANKGYDTSLNFIEH